MLPYLRSEFFRTGLHLLLHRSVGLPELDPDKHEGKLLRDGIYGRVRHPRYLAVTVGMVGWALFVNYLAIYVTVPVMFAFLCLIAWLEEDELVDRFGAEYMQYQAEVPMLMPRLGKR